MPGPALARDLLAGGHVDHVDREIGQLGREGGGEIVAARFDEHDLELGPLAHDVGHGREVDRGILADRRVRAAAGLQCEVKQLSDIVTGDGAGKDQRRPRHEVKDAFTRDALAPRIAQDFDFVPWAPLIFTSSITGHNVTKLFDLALEIDKRRQQKIPTPALNRWLRDQVEKDLRLASKTTSQSSTTWCKKPTTPRQRSKSLAARPSLSTGATAATSSASCAKPTTTPARPSSYGLSKSTLPTNTTTAPPKRHALTAASPVAHRHRGPSVATTNRPNPKQNPRHKKPGIFIFRCVGEVERAGD